MNFSGISRDTTLGKLLRLPLRLIPANMILPILQGPMRGMRWVAGSGDHGYWLGSYEITFQRRFSEELKPGYVVLDIGAHVGYYTLLGARRVGPTGHVFAFEPLPNNAAFVERHVRINRLENVTVRSIAISDRTGKTSFGAGISSSTGRIYLTGDLEVETASIDALLKNSEIRIPDVLKIDVEGAETEVLLGAQDTLQSYSPTILIATHGPNIKKRCIRILRSYNYTLRPINAADLDKATELLARCSK